MVNDLYENQEEMRQEAFRKLRLSYRKVQDSLDDTGCPFHQMARNELNDRMDNAETDDEIARLEEAEVCEFCIVDYEAECQKHGKLLAEAKYGLIDLINFMETLIK